MSINLKAIIFDMDGVIVDTEFVDFQIQTDFVRAVNDERGISSDGLDFASLMGRSYDALYRQLSELTGNVMPIDELRRSFTEFDAARRTAIDYRSLFRADIVPILAWAHNCGFKVAVASSSTHADIAERLDACGILNQFDVIESGEHLAESKPNPEIYLNTLRELGVSANEAVTVEDSAHGIEAAKAAGITCIAYRETRVPIDQSAADSIADDMTEVGGIMRVLAGE